MPTEPHTPNRDELRQQLYELVDDGFGRPLAETRRRALEIGREYLGVTSGHIQRRNADGTDDVIASVGATHDSF